MNWWISWFNPLRPLAASERMSSELEALQVGREGARAGTRGSFTPGQVGSILCSRCWSSLPGLSLSCVLANAMAYGHVAPLCFTCF